MINFINYFFIGFGFSMGIGLSFLIVTYILAALNKKNIRKQLNDVQKLVDQIQKLEVANPNNVASKTVLDLISLLKGNNRETLQ